MEKDHCMICKVETAYDKNTHIDMRMGYIEGFGQLCPNCYDKGSVHKSILVPEYIINGTPNNNELGAKVRQLYWDVKSL
jgi:hypothetical protein